MRGRIPRPDAQVSAVVLTRGRDEASGILILPPGTAEPGVRFTDAVPHARDTVFEIGLTPNRPDGLGHLGLAREAAALSGIAWTMPAPEKALRESRSDASQMIRV